MVRIHLTTGLLLILGIRGCLAADELHLIISPNSTTLTAKGFVDFDAYIYNSSDRRIQVPSPQEGFNFVWTLHDICKIRPDRNGSNSVMGIHTVDPYVINPRCAVRCEHLGAQFDSEPGDVLEFYITVERRLKSGAIQTIRSNSVIMYRPQK
jgi:hypothetical protein